MHAENRGRGDVGLRIGLELGHEVGRDVADDVHATGLQLGDLGRGLGDGAEHEVLEGRPATPVLIEGLQADHLVALPFHEFPRPGPHRRRRAEDLVADRLDVLLRDDREEDEPLEQERERLVGDDVDRLRVDHAHFLDRADVAVLGRLLRLVEHPIEGVLHVLRSHEVAVVELDSLAELELPLGVGERLPGRGERRLELELGAPMEQGVEHVDVDEDPDPLEVHMGIHGGRMRGEGDGERVFWLRVGRRWREGEHNECESDSQR